MTAALLLSALMIASSAAPAKGRAVAPSYEAGQREFKRGDYPAALRVLDAAAGDATEPAALSKIHLLRGQCFAASQDFSRAEEAFDLALESDPEAALDPAKVDPSLVKMLDGLRARLRGDLSVRADKPGQVTLDGKELGPTPLKASVAIGRHQLAVRSADSRFGADLEVVVRARRDNPFEVTLAELKGEPVKPSNPLEPERHPVADVRTSFEPIQYLEGPSFEVGGGVEQGPYRATIHARLFPYFGIALRGALLVPVADRLNVQIEVEVPLVFLNAAVVGLGGSGGVEYSASKWFGVFAEVGGRHYFTDSGYQPNRLTVQAGVRLRPP
jgi:hypothetical protein